MTGLRERHFELRGKCDESLRVFSVTALPAARRPAEYFVRVSLGI